MESTQKRVVKFEGFEPTEGPNQGEGILALAAALRARGAEVIRVTRFDTGE